jgi:hypothetical protein
VPCGLLEACDLEQEWYPRGEHWACTLSRQDDVLSRAGSIRLCAPRRLRVATANNAETLEALVGFKK